MKPVELYARVRHACHVEGLSQREAARRFGIDPKTVAKMLRHAVPPGYRRSRPPARPKLDGFTAIIDQIVMADRSAPFKQRHTAKRIYERLRAEHGFAGSYTIVKDYLRERHARAQEMFVPLAHPPGHAQADFGEAVAVIGGVRQKIHFFCLDLPHSDAGFVKAYPAERRQHRGPGHGGDGGQGGHRRDQRRDRSGRRGGFASRLPGRQVAAVRRTGWRATGPGGGHPVDLLSGGIARDDAQPRSQGRGTPAAPVLSRPRRDGGIASESPRITPSTRPSSAALAASIRASNHPPYGFENEA